MASSFTLCHITIAPSYILVWFYDHLRERNFIHLIRASHSVLVLLVERSEGGNGVTMSAGATEKGTSAMRHGLHIC